MNSGFENEFQRSSASSSRNKHISSTCLTEETHSALTLSLYCTCSPFVTDGAKTGDASRRPSASGPRNKHIVSTCLTEESHRVHACGQHHWHARVTLVHRGSKTERVHALWRARLLLRAQQRSDGWPGRSASTRPEQSELVQSWWRCVPLLGGDGPPWTQFSLLPSSPQVLVSSLEPAAPVLAASSLQVQPSQSPASSS